jgi:predicted transcriptional regulator
LELLRSEDVWLHEHKEEIAEKIERGFADFERGEFFTPDESRADMKKRKAAWFAERKR